ncbi:Catechol 2,3-dioxygenase [Halogranum rubrum]|uniref:Catechol 2,3-dioxygenase n=1 Tax=Halogranum rubrum TaxID=553466 RepID=A0A1I4ATW6_9EURY|nr:VOC family protein [Halogranum rubrum]SFK59076.1 Catechol 2,3-dioxygenase [Halogranum rubrum]
MGFEALHHVVLVVENLAEAETFYCELFKMDVRFREGERDGDYGRVPDHPDWETAVADGVTPAMSFLGNGALSLALAASDDPVEGGRVDHLAFQVNESFFDSFSDRARSLGCAVDERETTAFVTDRYGMEWELKTSSPPPTCPFEEI